MAELKVELGADIKGLISALDQTEKRVSKTVVKLTELSVKNTRVQNSIDKLTQSYKSGATSEFVYARNLVRLEKLQESYEKDIKSTQTQLSKLNSQYKLLGGGAGKAGSGVGKLNKATANANPTLQEFSRVIQDAPYGIQGVGNNITQLVSQFGYLSKASGGASGAIKALAGSFLGPGGILFLISTAVSLLTVYGTEMFKSKTSAEKLAEAQEDLAKSLDDYQKSLTGVNKARIEGNQSAAEELTKLNLLKNRIEDTTVSLDLRKDGIKELRKEFPAYFKDVKDEALLNGKLEGTYKKLTTSIINRAKSVAATNLLVENAKKEIAITQQIEDLKDQAAKKELEIIKSRNTASKASSNVVAGGVGSVASKLIDQAEIQEDINDLKAKEVELGNELVKINEQNTKLSNFVQDNATITPDLKPPKTPDKLKKLFKDVSKDLELLDTEEFEQQNREIEGIFKASGAAMAADAKEREQLIDLTKSVNEVEEFQKKLNEVRNLLGDSEFDFSTIISNDDIDAFIGRLERATEGAQLFGDAVGASISQVGGIISEKLETGNAVIDAFIGTFISGLSQMAASALQSLILNKALAKLTQSVEYGKSAANGITIATSAAAALGPAGLPALPGLIAGVQATIAGAFAGIQSFAKGSGGFSGDNNLAMLNRNEMILRPMEQSALYNSIRNHNLGSVNNGVGAQNISSEQVQWRLEGTDIVGSVRNTMRKNTRTGGSLTL